MAIFQIPCSFCKTIDKQFKNYWWAFPNRKTRNLTLKSWSSIRTYKTIGGLGLRKMELVKHALVTKLDWHFLTQHSSFWASALHGKYVKGHDFWGISAPPTSSWFWNGLLNTRSTPKQALCMQIYKGTTTSIWMDLWIPSISNFIP